MNRNNNSLLVRLIEDQHAQILPVMAFMVIAFMSIAAFSLSIGTTAIQQHQLQASANAAALAGAQQLPNSTAATVAATYSSGSGDNNSNSNLPGVTMASGYPKLKCLTTLTNEGVLCVAPANANAIQVQQQMTVPILFGGLFGGKATTTLTATATASARGTGATVAPYNVAIIADSTGSMSSDRLRQSMQFHENVLRLAGHPRPLAGPLALQHGFIILRHGHRRHQRQRQRRRLGGQDRPLRVP